MSDTEYHSWWHKEVGLIRMILFGISCWLVLSVGSCLLT